MLQLPKTRAYFKGMSIPTNDETPATYVPYPAPQGNQHQLQHQPQPYPQLQHQPQPHPQFQAQHQSSDTQKQAPNGNPLLLGATPQREM